ncbi:MAG: hypothetical protein QNK37_35135, partial [Acidobacteriota bacterium]|nr:hypothetical protein [Acidobacteriota bacterium]
DGLITTADHPERLPCIIAKYGVGVRDEFQFPETGKALFGSREIIGLHTRENLIGKINDF